VLHPDTCAEFEKLPKQIAAVLAKHANLIQWKPPKDDSETGGAADNLSDPSKEANIIHELVTQRDLLFRKNQIAVGAASQSKRDCAQDVRRLTSENAALIAEMNLLRNEQTSWKKSYKELEARMLAVDAEANARSRLSGKTDGAAVGGAALNRSASQPNMDASQGNSLGGKPRSKGPGGATADTPYIRRKEVNQQEVYRRQKVKGMHQLPPVNQNDPRMKATIEEKRFAQSLDQVSASRKHMERQGFDMASLGTQAQAMAGHRMLQTTGVPEPAALAEAGEPGSFPAGEGIQTTT